MLFITDRRLSDKALTGIIRSACSNGLKAVQLREKDLPDGNLQRLASRIRSVTKKYKSQLIINDRLDIALLSSADGVQVPVNGLQNKIIKKSSPELVTGKSVHSLNDSLKAQKEGFDYLLFGPVFRTPAKVKYGSPQGLEKLKQICGKVNIPVFAVGGITPSRAKRCLQTGAYGVAVIRELMQSGNIKKAMKDFERALGEL